MARKYNRHPEDAKLWKAIDEMDAQMEAEGIEDATAWPLFGEYESILYTIAERSVERESRWHDETDELIEFIELVEVAEENARAELGEFGYCEAPFDTAGAEDWPDETYTMPRWYAAWRDACNDWFDLTGELASDEVLGLA